MLLLVCQYQMKVHDAGENQMKALKERSSSTTEAEELFRGTADLYAEPEDGSPANGIY